MIALLLGMLRLATPPRSDLDIDFQLFGLHHVDQVVGDCNMRATPLDIVKLIDKRDNAIEWTSSGKAKPWIGVVSYRPTRRSADEVLAELRNGSDSVIQVERAHDFPGCEHWPIIEALGSKNVLFAPGDFATCTIMSMEFVLHNTIYDVSMSWWKRGTDQPSVAMQNAQFEQVCKSIRITGFMRRTWPLQIWKPR